MQFDKWAVINFSRGPFCRLDDRSPQKVAAPFIFFLRQRYAEIRLPPNFWDRRIYFGTEDDRMPILS